MDYSTNHKTCALMLAMGGPDMVDDIPEYLRNVFSDRALIRLPGGSLTQPLFARIISRLRSKSVQSHYRLIGGGSPLLKWTNVQARLLEEDLQHEWPEFRCFVGMRYFRPMIESAIDEVVSDGFTRMILIPMYPQYSTATTGSCVAEAERVLAKYRHIKYVTINDYHDHEGYVALMREYISDHIRRHELLMFSAHSLPQRLVDDGDPYEDQIRRNAALAANGREYVVSFQSRTGPVTWVGPDTIDTARELLDQGQSLFIVPISFVCDHIETQYELDIELPEILGGDAWRRIRRMPMYNDDRRFAAVLADCVRARVASCVAA